MPDSCYNHSLLKEEIVYSMLEIDTVGTEIYKHNSNKIDYIASEEITNFRRPEIKLEDGPQQFKMISVHVKKSSLSN